MEGKTGSSGKNMMVGKNLQITLEIKLVIIQEQK
jgi:hypothetical protein